MYVDSQNVPRNMAKLRMCVKCCFEMKSHLNATQLITNNVYLGFVKINICIKVLK